MKGTVAGLLVGAVAGPGCIALGEGGEEHPFQSQWPAGVERPWLGRSYWTNPLQDWRLSGGRVELVGSGTDRNVQHLTRQVEMGQVEAGQLGDGQSGEAEQAAFELRVEVGFVAEGRARAGFEVGVKGPLGDYRNNAVHGTGLKAGLTSGGQLFIGDAKETTSAGTLGDGGVTLRLRAVPEEGSSGTAGQGGAAQDSGVEARRTDTTGATDGPRYTLFLRAMEAGSENELGRVQKEGVPAAALSGNLALFADFENESPEANGGAEKDGTAGLPWGEPRLWFQGWEGNGMALATHSEQAFGPILFNQYTLSRGVMKMTAQLPPMGAVDGSTVRLETRQNGAWETVAEAEVHERARTATVRVEGWDDTRDVPYRLAYDYRGSGGQQTHHYEGTVRRDPVDQDEIVVGGFSCATDTAFPHPNVAEGARQHDPDLLAFTGDQYYESSGGYGVERQRDDLERATLDVLRKWMLHGWAFGDLMRDRPTVCLLDDHDVYHGNIWGEGGKQVDRWELHDNGGYFMPPEWVNAVQRMQTAHLPDPYDPTPVKNDISVYYTDMVYGRISFALLEDRKWKTGPDGFLPPNPGRADHIEDPDFDPSTVDRPGAKLLGDRQLSFLEEWAADWRGADMKAVISQSTFSQVPTHHGGNFKHLVADLDSNGWPQTPRNEALRRIRKGFAVHLGGDQHLPMLLRYGVEDWNDAPYNLCVPGVAVGYLRAFWPEKVGGESDPIGEYADGLGNKVTVEAVANPTEDFAADAPLETLANKSSGYGLLRFDKSGQEITAECWPILSDPTGGAEEQYAGWPQTFAMQENDGREPVGHLPQLQIDGPAEVTPMVQVVEEQSEEIVYTLRLGRKEFRPPVYTGEAHTVRVGDDTEWRAVRKGLEPTEDEVLEISL